MIMQITGWLFNFNQRSSTWPLPSIGLGKSLQLLRVLNLRYPCHWCAVALFSVEIISSTLRFCLVGSWTWHTKIAGITTVPNAYWSVLHNLRSNLQRTNIFCTDSKLITSLEFVSGFKYFFSMAWLLLWFQGKQSM